MTKDNINRPEYLVETEWLEQHLDDPNIRIFECTVNNKMNLDPVRGKTHPFAFEADHANYNEKHIPGAGYIDILGDLSDPSSDLPMMRPSEQQFADEVKVASGGKLNIKVHSGGSLFKHPEIKNAVRGGQVPIGEFLLSRLSNENAVFQVDSIPFLATNYTKAEILWKACLKKPEQRSPSEWCRINIAPLPILKT